MTASPDRVLAQVVLTACAVAGFLIVLTLELLMLGAGSSGLAGSQVWCLVAPVSSFDVVVHASAVAIGVLALLPLLAGMRAASRARAGVGELRQMARTARLRTPPRVAAAAALARVSGRVDVVEVPRPFAFAYGWIRPRICLSTGLVSILTDDELQAVLHHEGWHMWRRDPLRLLLAQAVGAAFAAVPEIRRLVGLYVLSMEVAADRHVVAVMGEPRWLASALIKTMGAPFTAPAFEGHAGARVAALAGAPPSLPRWRGRIAVVALLIEFAILVPLLTNGSVVTLAGVWIHPIC